MLDKGVISPPRITTSQRDALSLDTSDAGFIYNATTGQHETWDGISWHGVAPHAVICRQFTGFRAVAASTLEVGQPFTATILDRGDQSLQVSGADGIAILQGGLYRITTTFECETTGTSKQAASGVRVGSVDTLHPETVRPQETNFDAAHLSTVSFHVLSAGDIVQAIFFHLSSGDLDYIDYTLTVEEV